ncbi:MAG: hypothetical protein LBR47_03910 [Spirochaetaceae bacterium]|jgi:hypothetical protein|nr:hypothetical protein [Spirochaetaceae bacterium]
MGLKLFDKVGVQLNLKIDDPAFKKLVDAAGYVTAYHFILKFDYHSFGGTVTWIGDTPNPIPGGVYNFRNVWTNVSLLFRIDELTIKNTFLKGLLSELLLIGSGNLGAIGISYASFEMPLEYQVQPNRGLSAPGFGLIKGEAWGMRILWDTLIKRMENSALDAQRMQDRTGYELFHLFVQKYLWIYVEWFHGFIVQGKTDAQAIAWMSNAHNGVSVNGNISKGMEYAIVKGILGFQNMWNVGKKGRIGIAVGVELLEETIDANNDDIDIHFWSRHIGPAVRVSARW